MLQTLVTQGRSKLEKSQEDSQALESVLSELQEQTDNAKGLITETFISTGFLFIIPLYRTLQKCRKTSEQFSAYWKVAA